MTVGTVISFCGLAGVWLLTIAGVIIWAVRQEGRINLANQKIEANAELNSERHKNLTDKLTTAIQALIKFDENTMEQMNSYKTHTDFKIEELGKAMSVKFEKVFDKLDNKADKADSKPQ